MGKTRVLQPLARESRLLLHLSVSVSMADKGLEVLRKHRSSLNSTSAPRERGHSGGRLPSRRDRPFSHLPVLPPMEVCCLLRSKLEKSAGRLARFVLCLDYSPLLFDHMGTNPKCCKWQGGVSIISLLKEKGSERREGWSITGCAAAVKKRTGLLQPQDTLQR